MSAVSASKTVVRGGVDLHVCCQWWFCVCLKLRMTGMWAGANSS